jgi:hypothetical protein
MFELFYSLDNLLKFRILGEKSLEEVKVFFTENSPEPQEKLEKFLLKIFQKVGKIKLQNIPTLMNSPEFRQLNKTYYQLRLISLPNLPIKDLKSKRLIDIYLPKKGLIEKNILKDIKKKYQDQLFLYDLEFLIEEAFKKMMLEELQKPD